MRLIAGLMALSLLVTLAACTPADEQYCQRFGVGGTSEFGKCLDYYHQQQAWFYADYQPCADQADMTYPPTLYDYGHYEHVMGGGWNGRYYGGQTIRVEPDYRHNAEVDRLRARLIEPCMQAKGWNSGSSWQAGRHAVARVPALKQSLPWGTQAPAAPANAALPWMK